MTAPPPAGAPDADRGGVRYRRRFPVLFRHCDPAGIVFYPRYFEMVNDLLEAFLSDLGYPFSALHGELDAAVPTVGLEADFPRPSRLGEVLDIELEPLSVGRSSFRLRFTARHEDEVRFVVTSTLVYAHTKGDQGSGDQGSGGLRSAPLPPPLANGLRRHLEPLSGSAAREAGTS